VGFETNSPKSINLRYMLQSEPLEKVPGKN